MTNKTSKQILKELSRPFNPSEVKSRTQSGVTLHYIDARAVMDRLDEVVGVDGWRPEYYTVQAYNNTHNKEKKDYKTGALTPAHNVESAQLRTMCKLTVRIGDKEITKEDGAGDSQVEAEKGAISDALKRAAVCFGIGRYLYDTKYKPEQHYEISLLEEEIDNCNTKEELTEWANNNKDKIKGYADRLRTKYSQRLKEV